MRGSSSNPAIEKKLRWRRNMAVCSIIPDSSAGSVLEIRYGCHACHNDLGCNWSRQRTCVNCHARPGALSRQMPLLRDFPAKAHHWGRRGRVGRHLNAYRAVAGGNQALGGMLLAIALVKATPSSVKLEACWNKPTKDVRYGKSVTWNASTGKHPTNVTQCHTQKS